MRIGNSKGKRRSRTAAGMGVALCFCIAATVVSQHPATGANENQAPAAGASVADQAVSWTGEQGLALRARFGVENGRPLIRELAFRKGDAWVPLARNLVPEFEVKTGIRRTGHGLPEEKRWDVYWDAPLNQPGEVKQAAAVFSADRLEVKQNGARTEVSFPGVTMGPFAGRLQFTVYRGSNLIRVEVIAKTDEPSLAYKYSGGLRGFEAKRLVWRDVAGRPQSHEPAAAPDAEAVPVRARNRLLVLETGDGSVACFPPPHQFFFPRQLEVNLGFVWYRQDGKTIATGVRHGDTAEGYNQTFIDKVFPLYNAPPGTWQRMAAYFYVSPGRAEECREAALAYTHGDRYKPLPGYKTMVEHFHMAFWEEFQKAPDTEPEWIPLMRNLGVNIVYLNDFHGDGHPKDNGAVRLKEQETYYAACRRWSDRDFLILPGEEPNVYFGGHWEFLPPKPVYFTLGRNQAQPFIEKHPQYGTVYHLGGAGETLEMLQKENALVWTSHPRTKGSTGYPDKMRDADWFRSDRWLGAAFKALPADLSQPRLGEVRCLGTLDDLNNWGAPKYMLGEVDTYKKFADYDLYGDFNVNYVKVDRLPPADDWSTILSALRAGEFFVTTGEVLIKRFEVGKAEVTAEVEWTFPLEFVEAVWGDGAGVERKVVSAADLPPFGTKEFRLAVPAGAKWVRFAAWDSAVNGAFTQPVHRKP